MVENQVSFRHVPHVEKGHNHVSTRAPGVVALSQLRHLSYVATTPGGNSALDAALREAKDVCPRAGRGFAEPDESTFEERGSMT